jgi:hypothetical protein
MHIAFYDAAIVTLIVVSTIGAIWAGFKMSRHSREIRVYQQVRLEYPLGVWPHLPKWNEPKKFPAWLVKVADYFLPIPKKEK